jgi:hypothetical protein
MHMHPLNSVWLKIIRAKEHLDSLYSEIQMFWLSKPKPFDLIPEDDTKESEKVFKFKVNREPPIRWSVIVGDIAFDLRSALDHLAWQLALLTTSTPCKGTEFPIFDCASNFKKGGKGGAASKMQNIPPEAQEIIESLQPYHQEDELNLVHLWWLHELNRIDKHRELIPCFTSSMIKYSDMSGIFRPSGRLNDGARIVIPIPKGKLKTKIGAEIAFDVPTLDSPLPFEKIDGIHKFIREEVIPRFYSFFPKPEEVEHINVHQ